MIFEDIYKDVIDSFGTLWKVKERSKTLEIIAPFASTSQKFSSVFLSHRDGEYIVSDGGWISEGVYQNSFDRKIDCFEKIISHYKNTLQIKEVKNKNGSIYFYKKTTKKIAIPSLIFDVSNFVSTIVSMSGVEFSDKENETENNFNKSARNFLQKIHPKSDWYFNEYVGSKKQVKVSAILRKKNQNLILI